MRAYDQDMDFEEAVKLLLVSFDSTVKSNLSVGLPFDVQTYTADSFKVGHAVRIDDTDEVYQAISAGWGDALKAAFQHLPTYKL